MAKGGRRAAAPAGGKSERIARATVRLARAVAATEREEERLAGRISHALDRAKALAPLDGDGTPVVQHALAEALPYARRRALLIVNSKSGPRKDSLVHVREIVEQLGRYGVRTEVRVKLRKKQARRAAQRAARAGLPLVVAAGGDGTVEAVAAGLVGTQTALGIVPLGTYNNVAGSLGVPAEIGAACAQIGRGVTRAVDAGRVAARGRKRPQVFLEMGAVGVTAALMPAGQGAKEGAWDAAAQLLPAAVAMSPTPATLRVDGEPGRRQVHTLLVEVANAPRMGPALTVAPQARMDDGLLDLAVYHDMTQAALVARVVALETGAPTDDPRIERAHVRRVEVRAAQPLPVMADSKVVGTTPARFEVLPGALQVIAGHGPGLAHPVAEALLQAAEAEAHALVPVAPLSASRGRAGPDRPLPGTPAGNGLMAATAAAVAPLVGQAMDLAERARALAVPAALVAGGAAAVPLLRALVRLGRR